VRGKRWWAWGARRALEAKGGIRKDADEPNPSAEPAKGAQKWNALGAAPRSDARGSIVLEIRPPKIPMLADVSTAQLAMLLPRIPS
jgi:hypothetical protein